jgi:tetratricopeptide (TPR) repeat protein
LKDRNYVYALDSKGLALFNLGRLEEAIEYYDRVLDIEPKHAKALYNRAIANVRLSNVDDCLSDLKKAIEIDKKYYVKLAKKDKRLDSIRNDKRFRALIMN